MKINHERRSLLLAEWVATNRWTCNEIWMIRKMEQTIHDTHGKESHLYLANVKMMIMHLIQKTKTLFNCFAQPFDPTKLNIKASLQPSPSPKPAFLTDMKQKKNNMEGSTCPECGSSHHISTHAVQIRRADESETIFCICKDCASKGKTIRWRLN